MFFTLLYRALSIFFSSLVFFASHVPSLDPIRDRETRGNWLLMGSAVVRNIRRSGWLSAARPSCRVNLLKATVEEKRSSFTSSLHLN